jgi:hypothetical protein
VKHRIPQIYGTVTVLNVLLFAAIYMRSPEILIEEDMLLENLTASVFAMAAVIGLIMAIFHWRGNGWHAWLTLLVPFLAGLAALDEISFGKHEYLLTVPFLKVYAFKIDGVHDLVLLAWSILETDKPLYLVAYGIVLLAAGAAAWVLWRRFVTGSPNSCLRELGPRTWVRFLLVAVGLVCVALALDLDLVEVRVLIFVEELLEFNAAVALIFAARTIGIGVGPLPAAAGDGSS